MGGLRCSDYHLTALDPFARSDSGGVGVSQAVQPFSDRRRGEDWNPPRQACQGVERKMVRVSVRHEHRIDFRELVKRDSRRAHPGQNPAQGRIEIRVGEKSLPTDLN